MRKRLIRLCAVIALLLFGLNACGALATAPDDYDEWADAEIGVRGRIGYDVYPKLSTAELGDSSVDAHVYASAALAAIIGAAVAHERRKRVYVK